VWAGMLAVAHSADVPRLTYFGAKVPSRHGPSSARLLDEAAVVLWDPGSVGSDGCSDHPDASEPQPDAPRPAQSSQRLAAPASQVIDRSGMGCLGRLFPRLD
jgi:hypothetical protein